jgi:hypothetical protein
MGACEHHPRIPRKEKGSCPARPEINTTMPLTIPPGQRRRGSTSLLGGAGRSRGSLLLVRSFASSEFTINIRRFEGEIEKTMFEKSPPIHASDDVQLDGPQVVESTHSTSAVLREFNWITRIDAKCLHQRIQHWAVRADDGATAWRKSPQIIELRLSGRARGGESRVALQRRGRDIDYAVAGRLVKIAAVEVPVTVEITSETRRLGDPLHRLTSPDFMAGDNVCQRIGYMFLLEPLSQSSGSLLALRIKDLFAAGFIVVAVVEYDREAWIESG